MTLLRHIFDITANMRPRRGAPPAAPMRTRYEVVDEVLAVTKSPTHRDGLLRTIISGVFRASAVDLFRAAGDRRPFLCVAAAQGTRNDRREPAARAARSAPGEGDPVRFPSATVSIASAAAAARSAGTRPDRPSASSSRVSGAASPAARRRLWPRRPKKRFPAFAGMTRQDPPRCPRIPAAPPGIEPPVALSAWCVPSRRCGHGP